jgi:hypothetical protein
VPWIAAGVAAIVAASAGGTALFGATMGSLVIIKALIWTGTSLIIGGISKRLNRKPGSNTLALAQWRQTTVRHSAPPWRIVYGRARIGGYLSFRHVTGTNNEFYHLIITLTGHQIEEITTIFFNDETVPLDGSGDATGKYAGYVHVEKSLGDPTDATQPFSSLQTAAPTKWTANHLQRGRSKIYVRLKWNADLFPTGVPNITCLIKGALVYDDRITTTQYSENTALCTRDWLTNSDYGFGAAASEIDDTLNNAAANVCDEDVSLKAGGTEDRYTANGVIESTERPSEVLGHLTAAMAGTVVYLGGKFRIYAGAWRAPTVTLTDSELRGPITVQTRISRAELFNAVKGVYLAPLNNWLPSDFPPVTNSSYETEDSGEKIWKDIELRFTVSSSMAQRIGKIELERVRQQTSVQLPCKLHAYEVQPPEVVQFTHSRFSWSAETFEIAQSQLVQIKDEHDMPALAVDLFLRKTASSVYSWTPATDEQDENTPGTTTLPDLSTVAAPTSLNLTEVVKVRIDGTRDTVLHADWTAPADEAVQSGGFIDVQYKKSASGTWLRSASIEGAETETDVASVEGGNNYDCRIRARNAEGVVSAWVTETAFAVVGDRAEFFEIEGDNPYVDWIGTEVSGVTSRVQETAGVFDYIRDKTVTTEFLRQTGIGFGINGSPNTGMTMELFGDLFSLTASQPAIRGTDTTVGGNDWQMYVGNVADELAMHDVIAATDRLRFDAGGYMGHAGAPVTNIGFQTYDRFMEIENNSVGGAALHLDSTQVSGRQWSWYSGRTDATNILLYDADAVADRMRWDSGGAIGHLGAPATNLTTYGRFFQAQNTSSVGLLLNSTGVSQQDWRVYSGLSAAGELSVYDADNTSHRTRFDSGPAIGHFGAPGAASTISHSGNAIINSSSKVAATRVETTSVENNAINVDGAYVNDANFSLTTSEQVVGTVTISTNGGEVEVYGKWTVNANTPLVFARLRKDSVSGTILDQADNLYDGPVNLQGLDTSPASSQTYVITGWQATGTTRTAQYRRLIAANRKK